MDIIKELKENEKALVLLPEDRQMFILQAYKTNDLVCLASDLKERWYTPDNIDWNLPTCWNSTYRLRPDYEEPEPEVVKCEVLDMGNQLCFVAPSGHETYLSGACEVPDFIGFLYEDETIATATRLYRKPRCTPLYHSISTHDKYEVLTPTHVLFRGKHG